MVMATAAVVVVGDLPWLEPLIATGAVLASLLVGAWIMAAVVSIRRVKHRGTTSVLLTPSGGAVLSDS
jgi:hypothetical protein